MILGTLNRHKAGWCLTGAFLHYQNGYPHATDGVTSEYGLNQ